MEYKYTLDRSSKKFICPNCRKKRFVKYIDLTTKNYLEVKYGRCDRESSCGYHVRPNGANLKSSFSIRTSLLSAPPSFLNQKLVGKHATDYNTNCFVKYLLKKFNEEDVIHVIRKYRIGTSNHWKGSTIFWQINENGQVHTGKVMLYNSFSGKRIKKPYPHINWMHKVLQLNHFVLQQCLFGLHLLKNFKGEIICLVESEKTAIVMSLILPQYLWLATGSKSNFKEQMLHPLKDCQILVYPDKQEYEVWDTKCKTLSEKGFKIRCSKLLEHSKLNKGSDLADLV